MGFLYLYFCSLFAAVFLIHFSLTVATSNATAHLSGYSSSLWIQVHCDGIQFGAGLRSSSCMNAWAKIVPSLEPQIYAQRLAQEDESGLPSRFLSGRYSNLEGYLEEPLPREQSSQWGLEIVELR